MTTHRMSGTPEYIAWAAMKGRCLNPRDRRFHRYGGRGIKVCKKWLTFEGFFADMGQRPPGTSLDRINNDGNYTRRNCAWIPLRDQPKKTCRIRYLTHNGQTKSVAEWARTLGVRGSTLSMRLNKYKWPVNKVLGGAL